MDEVKKVGLPLSAVWQNAAEELVERSEVVEVIQHYAGKYFRGRFFDTIASVYHAELLKNLKVDSGMEKKAVADGLNLDAATLSRHNKKKKNDPNKFFAVVLLMLKKNLNQLNFPDRREMAFQAMSKQMMDLGEEFCQPTISGLNRVVLASLIYAMRDKEVDKLIPTVEIAQKKREAAAEKILVNVNAVLRKRYDNFVSRQGNSSYIHADVTVRELIRWLADWGMPYTLLAMGTEGADWGLEDA